jgi:hypothetical protein
LKRLFRIDWQAGVDPRFESTVKRMHVFPTGFSEFLRHPGAGSFVRSGAVRYDCAVFWDFVEMLGEFIAGYANGVGQFRI